MSKYVTAFLFSIHMYKEKEGGKEVEDMVVMVSIHLYMTTSLFHFRCICQTNL